MKNIETIKEEMNRLGWCKIEHSISKDDIEYFKKDFLSSKKTECDKYGKEFLIEKNYLDILKCNFKFEKNYIELIECDWLNQIVDCLLNQNAVLYDFFGLLNPNYKEFSNKRNKFHRDQAYLGGMRASILVIIPLVDFNEEIGPTEIVPSSHVFKNKPSEKFMEDHSIKLIAKEGEVFVVDASLWHRGGDNLTDGLRPTIIIRYQLPFLKRPVDLTKFYEKEIDSASLILKKRLGVNCVEGSTLEDCVFDPTFKMGQYNMEGLFYNE